MPEGRSLVYLAELKATLRQGLVEVFTAANYPNPDFASTYVSLEYPVRPEEIPSVWVDFAETENLRIAGIDQHDFVVTGPDQFTSYAHWRFAGSASFTIVALSSLERDRMYDEIIRIFAFSRGDDNSVYNIFKQYIEQGNLIAMNMNFDEIEPQGNAAAPGTPWGTDEIMYEKTINMNLIGEFLSNGSDHTLVPLEHWIVNAIGPGQTSQSPAYPGHPDNTPHDPNAWQGDPGDDGV